MISVIVPVYNAELYLSDCLESIINQSYKDIEVILINDGSKDSSLDICKLYANKDSRIKVFSQENSGVSKARNFGISKSTGEFITFVDSDDLLEKEMIEVLFENMISKDYDLSLCGLKFINLDGTKDNDKSLIKNGEYLNSQLLNAFFCEPEWKKVLYGPYNKLFKKSIIRDLEFSSDLKLGEDLLFVYQYLMSCTNVIFDNKNLYHYIKRENSATTKTFNISKMDYLYGCEKIYDLAQLYNDSILKENALIWYYSNVLSHMRMLIGYPEVRKKCSTGFVKYRSYLTEYKNNVWNFLSLKQKISYFLIIYLPFIIKLLKRFGYRI